MFKTNPVSLKELLDNVDSGKIQLPDFQRGWVWDDDRIRGLLASVSRGFPVGAALHQKCRLNQKSDGLPLVDRPA